MTRDDAIRYIKDNVCYGQEECFDCVCKSTEDNPCAVEMAIEALEKQIPKRPIEYEDKFYACPVCGNPLLHKWEEYPAKLMSKDKGLPYCLGCGQRIDWSENDE